MACSLFQIEDTFLYYFIKSFLWSVVTFSYALLEVNMGKYDSLVTPKNYPETTYVHILLEP